MSRLGAAKDQILAFFRAPWVQKIASSVQGVWGQVLEAVGAIGAHFSDVSLMWKVVYAIIFVIIVSLVIAVVVYLSKRWKGKTKASRWMKRRK